MRYGRLIWVLGACHNETDRDLLEGHPKFSIGRLKARYETVGGTLRDRVAATLAPGQRGPSTTSRAHRRAQWVQGPAPGQRWHLAAVARLGRAHAVSFQIGHLPGKRQDATGETHINIRMLTMHGSRMKRFSLARPPRRQIRV